jgi:competence protein ComEA
MTADKLSRFWLMAVGALILIILISSVTIWIRRDNGQPVKVISPDAAPFKGQVYIEGAIINPGTYSLQAGDTIDGIIQASGGTDNNADLSRMQLFIPRMEEDKPPQRIDINRAEGWLLQALPGIGEVRAQAILDYRMQNGPFSDIEDLTKVPGISNSSFDKIKHLITVAE